MADEKKMTLALAVGTTFDHRYRQQASWWSVGGSCCLGVPMFSLAACVSSAGCEPVVWSACSLVAGASATSGGEGAGVVCSLSASAICLPTRPSAAGWSPSLLAALCAPGGQSQLLHGLQVDGDVTTGWVPHHNYLAMCGWSRDSPPTHLALF